MATIESVKAKIQGLIEKANIVTSREDTQLSPAVDALIAGYGSGGGGGGYIDVTELPDIANAEEGVVYRLVQATEASADILVAINDGSSVTTMTLAEMFAAQGASANIPIYIVPELPEVMKPIDEETLTIPFYIVESTGIAYLSLDGTNVNVGSAGDLFEGYDGGWAESSDDITIENTQPGMTAFCVRKEASVEIKGLYLAVDGEWQSYKEVIDVEELPVSGVNKHAIYRVGTHVEKDLYKVLAGGEIKRFSEWLIENGYEDNFSFNRAEFVDTIPATHDSTVAYIHNTTGAMYVDNGSGTLVPFVSDSLVTLLLGNYYGLYDADEVDLGRPGMYAVREGIVIEKHCVNTDGVWREFKSKSIFQEYVNGDLTELKADDLGGIYRISDYALANCKTLEKVTFSPSNGVIGNSAFENCENLQEIEFDDNIMGIGQRAFYGCKSLDFGDAQWYALRNLWDLGSYAFANCTSLKYANPTSGDNGGGYLFNVGEGLFAGCTALESATIDFRPDSGFLGCDGMFEGCTSLRTFIDYVSMNDIPNRMFKGCSSLTTIFVETTKAGWSSWSKGEKWDQGTPDYVIHCSDGDILKSDPESGSDDTPDAPVVPEVPADKYFEGNHTDVVLPNATKIKAYAFYNDKNLVNITIPNATSIGGYAFYGCSALTTASLSEAVTTIGAQAFNNCTNLALTSLPEALTEIGQLAFTYCSNIALTQLPSGVTSIGYEAFSRCTKLALTKLPDAITTLSDNTFNGCTQLDLKYLPSGLKSLTNYVFRNCSKLALTSLPAALNAIGGEAFCYCTGLTEITFEGTPTGTISSTAFKNCTNLKTINVPWAEGAVANAPWGATNATINYNYQGG